MKNPSLITIVFFAGLGAGWFGKVWSESYQFNFGAVITRIAGDDQNTVDRENIGPADSPLASQPELAVTGGNRNSVASDGEVPTDSQPATLPGLAQSSTQSRNQSSLLNPALDSSLQIEGQRVAEDSTGLSTLDTFIGLLKDRRYFSAMSLFQEQKQRGEKNATELRTTLIDELVHLTDVGNNSDFSELVENYLSIYYDDIDVLLLLAEFNRVNNSYFEVVDVFLLARTYAYSNADREKVDRNFNNFVSGVDNSYTEQKDWWSLISLYSHIHASGLMTSTLQYWQALAYLRSGDEAFAIEQFNQLLGDSLVGESAAASLSNLAGDAEVPPTVIYKSPLEGADAIALQKLGNQYAVNLDNNRQDSVQLLIDTGASMTAISRDSFNKLNASGDAVEQGSRSFRTANGVVQAPVFSIPELSLGPHRLENTQVAVIEFESDRGVGGLLGMNILGQFRFQIDQDSSNLLLNRK